jgi:hypothetical protein
MILAISHVFLPVVLMKDAIRIIGLVSDLKNVRARVRREKCVAT